MVVDRCGRYGWGSVLALDDPVKRRRGTAGSRYSFSGGGGVAPRRVGTEEMTSAPDQQGADFREAVRRQLANNRKPDGVEKRLVAGRDRRRLGSCAVVEAWCPSPYWRRRTSTCSVARGTWQLTATSTTSLDRAGLMEQQSNLMLRRLSEHHPKAASAAVGDVVVQPVPGGLGETSKRTWVLDTPEQANRPGLDVVAEPLVSGTRASWTGVVTPGQGVGGAGRLRARVSSPRSGPSGSSFVRIRVGPRPSGPAAGGASLRPLLSPLSAVTSR